MPKDIIKIIKITLIIFVIILLIPIIIILIPFILLFLYLHDLVGYFRTKPSEFMLWKGIIEESPDLIKKAVHEGADINKMYNFEHMKHKQENQPIWKLLSPPRILFSSNTLVPLITAIELFKSLEIIKLLISLGADINYATLGDCTTPLAAAVRKNNKALVQLLLEHKVEIKGFDRYWGDGPHPLAIALLENQNTDIAQLLIDAGTNIDRLNYEHEDCDYSMLMIAIEEDAPLHIMEFLIKNSADLDMKNDKEETALDLAEKMNIETIELIKQHMQKIEK